MDKKVETVVVASVLVLGFVSIVVLISMALSGSSSGVSGPTSVEMLSSPAEYSGENVTVDGTLEMEGNSYILFAEDESMEFNGCYDKITPKLLESRRSINRGDSPDFEVTMSGQILEVKNDSSGAFRGDYYFKCGSVTFDN